MKYPLHAQLARDARAATNLTQDAFATMLRSSKRTIAAWEAGEKPPSGIAQLVLENIKRGWRP